MRKTIGNGDWGNHHTHAFPENKGPSKEWLYGLTSGQSKVIKNRQNKKRRQRERQIIDEEKNANNSRF